MDLISILQNPESKYIVMPLVSIVAGIVVKVLCQNDQIAKSLKDWFYWTPSLLASNFILICREFSDCLGQADYSKNCLNALLINVIFSIAICIFIRKLGWNIRRNYLGWWCGIILPNLFSVLLMYVVLKTLQS